MTYWPCMKHNYVNILYLYQDTSEFRTPLYKLDFISPDHKCPEQSCDLNSGVANKAFGTAKSGLLTEMSSFDGFVLNYREVSLSDSILYSTIPSASDLEPVHTCLLYVISLTLDTHISQATPPLIPPLNLHRERRERERVVCCLYQDTYEGHLTIQDTLIWTNGICILYRRYRQRCLLIPMTSGWMGVAYWVQRSGVMHHTDHVTGADYVTHRLPWLHNMSMN